MGLFDGVRTMTALVKGGIATAKACETLDKLILRSVNEYKGSLTQAENDLYGIYNEVRLKKLDIGTAGFEAKASASVEEELETAQVAYLTALRGNGKLPRDFRNEIGTALKEYEEASEMTMNRIEGIMRKNARTPEEKAEIEKAFGKEK